MKPTLALLTLLAAAGVAHAAGTVQVSFVTPEKFTDVRDRSYRVEDNVKALEKVLIDVAKPHVIDGQTLTIEVLDVDLAGEVRPGLRAWDLRVLRGLADWPRITLRWRLEGAGAPRGGQAVVQDMAYLQRIQPPLSGTHLVYERRMLAEWIKKELGGNAVN
jgi:hypothetical protein